MPKHKPVHPIFNDRWNPVIEFLTDSLFYILFGVAGIVLSVLVDYVVQVFQGKDSR